MELRRVLALAASAVCLHHAESFAPHQRSLDQQLSDKLSELRYSTLEVAPEIQPGRKSTTSARRERQVEKLERQFLLSGSQSAITPLKTRKRPSSDTAANQPSTNSDSAAKQKCYPGLTRAQEVSYTFQIRTFRAVVQLREQLIQERGTPVPEAVWAKACGLTLMDLKKIVRNGQAARAAILAVNVGLVTSFAKKHYSALKEATEAGGGVGTILSLQDMIQEGNMGLMEAAERFEPEKGFRFSTYATWWVRQRILRAISDSSRIIRLPAHVHEMLSKIRKAKAQIKSQLGRDPTTPELARHLDVSEAKLQLYAESSRNVVSLERPLRTATFKDDSRTIGDTLASDAPTPEEDMEADYLRRDIRAVINTALVDREREVIVHRFGLEDGKPRSVEETALSLGITRDKVRLVEARALNKLRHPKRNYKLKEYIAIQDNNSNKVCKSDEMSRFTPYADFEKCVGGTQQPQDPSRIWFF